jgi:transcriptional regulator with AAA-type ATPase domain
VWIGSPRRRPRLPRQQVTLPRDFDPVALLAAVADLRHPPSESAGRGASDAVIVQYPYVPEETAAVAARAATSPFPVLIWGESGTGKTRVARAIHGIRGGAYLLSAAASDLDRALLDALPARLPSGAEITLMVRDLGALDGPRQQLLLDLLDTGELPGADERRFPVRLIALSREPAPELFQQGRLSKALFYRLNVLSLPLPPLRQRVADIPALAEVVSRAVCEPLGLPPVTLTPASLTRLSRYLWFGNLAELEAVLARSIALAPSRVIDVPDLLFGYGPIVRRLAPAMAEARGARAPVSNGATVDLIINELAHEFKNPMVTIKTFAQQLDHLLQEEQGGHAEVARLTGEAIERMDDALENLVQYTRFRQPHRQPTPLSAIISGALHALEERIAEKQIELRVEGSADPVLVDPSQVVYAIKNLLNTVLRDLGPGDLLQVRPSGPGAVAVDYPAKAHRTALQLRALVAPDGGRPALPLGFAFAKTLLERNDGRMVINTEGDPVRVIIEMPRAAGGHEVDGKSEGINR